MAQRSPYNDRYKVEQKGKTRRSASAAKPKRAIADLTPMDSPTKKSSQKQKPTSARGRAKAAWKSSGTADSTLARAEATPRMKQLRRVWWFLWVGALAVAVGILLMQQAGYKDSVFVPVLWAFWLAAMGGAFYLEFGPIRKERAVAMAAASVGKSGKADKGEKSGRASKKAPVIGASPDAPAPDDRQPPSSDDQA